MERLLDWQAASCEALWVHPPQLLCRLCSSALAGSPMVLSAAEIARFKEEGYLILRGFLDKDEVDSWREAFWAGITSIHRSVDPHDDSTWLPEAEMASDFKVPFGSHPKIQAVVEQLGAGKLAGGGAGMNIRWPQRGMDAEAADAALAAWRAPGAGHIDG
jgi:hypothetical protein